MRTKFSVSLQNLALLLIFSLTILQYGCSGLTPEENLTLGVLGTTVAGGRSPSTEIEQVYYLGVFDPQEQLPQEVYRIRVHGQASAISFTRFASGWVRADLIDSLGTGIAFGKNGSNISITKAGQDGMASLKTGRRLMLFGPEGFREAPKDHRLVIVMGSNPEDFFNAVDTSLGTVAGAMEERRNSQLGQLLFEALTHLKSEQVLLDELRRNIAAEITDERG